MALYFHIPPLAILGACPELLAFGIVNELPGRGVAADDGVRAVGDVAEVAFSVHNAAATPCTPVTELGLVGESARLL